MFIRAVGIAIDIEDKVYVTDCDRNRVQVFTSEGGFITKWGSFGTGPGEFDCPTGIVVDVLGAVYVVDSGNHRVQKFTFPVSGVPVPVLATTWGKLKSQYEAAYGARHASN